MPAIIAHRLFGEKALDRLGESKDWNDEQIRAFLLANQGPDPFAARFRATRDARRRCNDFGRAMQGSKATAAFMTLHGGMRRLPAGDAPVARAFVMGLACHYMLDRTAHPMIIAQELAIVEADPDLATSRREIHALIESELDSWMLLKLRGIDPEGEATASLARTRRICQIGGTLLAHVARTVYGINLDTRDYGRCVADYDIIYQLIEPRDTEAARAAFMIERRAFGHALLPQLSHDPCPGTCRSANEGWRPWTHPYLGVERCESFRDLFDEALDELPTLAEAVTRGDEKTIRTLVGGLNYAGMPDAD